MGSPSLGLLPWPARPERWKGACNRPCPSALAPVQLHARAPHPSLRPFGLGSRAVARTLSDWPAGAAPDLPTARVAPCGTMTEEKAEIFCDGSISNAVLLDPFTSDLGSEFIG